MLFLCKSEECKEIIPLSDVGLDEGEVFMFERERIEVASNNVGSGFEKNLSGRKANARGAAWWDLVNGSN